MPQKKQSNSKYTTVKVSVETAKSLRHKHIDTGEHVQDLADRAIKFFVGCDFPLEPSPEVYERMKQCLEWEKLNRDGC